MDKEVFPKRQTHPQTKKKFFSKNIVSQTRPWPFDPTFDSIGLTQNPWFHRKPYQKFGFDPKTN